MYQLLKDLIWLPFLRLDHCLIIDPTHIGMIDQNKLSLPYHVLGHDTEWCYCLQNIIQDHIDSGEIKIDAWKHKSNKSIDKTNSDLQIYTDLFPLHSANFISALDPPLDDGPFVNMVTITPICSPPS